MQVGDGWTMASVAAAAVGVSRERVIRLVQRGIVPGGNRYGRWLVDLAALERHLSPRPALVAA